MSHRCINAFLYDNQVYPGGQLVADDHPILETHADFFAKVEDHRVGSETASQGPGELRAPTPAVDPEAADVATWLAAESQYHEDVQAWLLAEEQYQTDVATWLAAEVQASTEAGAEKRARTSRTSK